MQVRCIRAAYGHEAGDLVEVPDGAAVSPVYFEPAEIQEDAGLEDAGQDQQDPAPPPAPDTAKAGA